MKHAGGRPRKPRNIEPCPCCSLSGYRYRKIVNDQSYHYFRHDDRNHRCQTCSQDKWKDCYIESQVREKNAVDLKTHPLRELLQFIDDFRGLFRESDKVCRMMERESKMWSQTVGEGGYQNEGVMFKCSLEITHELMSEIQSLFTLQMVQILLLLKGQELPPEIKAKIEEYRRSRQELINNPFVVDLIDNVFKRGLRDFYQLEMKYNLADKLNKKERWKQKLRDAW